jgi:hypothetical protein
MSKEKVMESKKEELEVLGVDRDDNSSILVDFSDGTTGTFTPEELNKVQPHRPDSNPDTSEVDPSIGYK